MPAAFLHRPARRRFLRAALCCAALPLAAFAAPPEDAPALLLAERHDGKADVSRYWASEKLDGVRAHWDGARLCFRSGRPVPAPAWFVAALPARPLDGELWLGRGTFARLSGLVRRAEPDDAEWRQVRYMIFELPDASGDFTARAAAIRALVADAGLPWLQAVEQFRLADAKALRRKLDEVVGGGGEGLMLHRADAPYATGRSADLLKVTPWLDAEARVVAHLPGKGKHAGRLGALRVEMPDGRRFSLGTGFSDAERRAPPPIGAQVTYRYRELTASGLPRFPRYLRVREDF
jgi:DNA ligase-1